jgi:N-acetylmuramoyl-L-alanine amidase
MPPRQRFAERLVQLRGRSSIGVAQGCCVQLLQAIRMAPLHSQTVPAWGDEAWVKVSCMLRGGERDSRSGGSACMAVIHILGAIIGAAVAMSTAGACEPASFPVAIDVGHDRDRPGAFSARGVPEFEFNRALGREVLAALLASGFSRSFLIGESGSPIGLRERTAIAERAGARVFISIHHDSVQPRYLERWIFEGRVQEHTTHARGFSLFVSAANSFFAASKGLALLMGSELRARGMRPSVYHAEPIEGENR